MVRSYLNRFEREETPYGSRIPVLHVQTPSPVTVKGMASAMLRDLGDPRFKSGTQWNMDGRLVNFIKECEVQFIILDDFHQTGCRSGVVGSTVG